MTISAPTRRGFLAGAASAGLAVALGGPARAADTPQRGGHFRLGANGAGIGDSLDPATYTGGTVALAMLAVCNNLTEIDAAGKLQPELAESWEATPDAKVWTFRLRKGVKFHDGRDLTARDVVASFNHHRGETKSAARAVLAPVSDVKAGDDHTVIFTLASGNADLPYLMTDYHFVVMPAKTDGTLDWEKAIGTGGYKLDRFEPGVRIAMTRFDGYFKTDRAWFESAEILAIADATARQNALIGGQIDAMNGVDPRTANLLKRVSTLRLENVVGTSHYTLPMFCDADPYRNLDVRLALKYAIDREALVAKVLGGFGQVGNDHPIAPANRYYAADLEQRAYDPEKARFHLRKAGLDGLKVQLSASNAAFSGGLDTAVLYQEAAARAGIEITVKQEADDGYWSDVWLKKPFVESYWNGRPTEDDMFSLVYAKGGPWNDAHWDNERFNALLLEARPLLDEARRREIYREMQQLVRDDGGTIIPMFANYVDATSTRIAHGPLSNHRYLDGWKCIERWWTA